MEKSIWFKKIVVFSFITYSISIFCYGQKTLPVYDGINYTVGTLAYDNTNWWCLNSSTTNDIGVTAGSLTYDGLLGSTGNKLSIGGVGDDIVIWFGDQVADTKIYYSFIFKITDMSGVNAGTPAHLAGFSNSPTTTSIWGCSFIIQKDVSDPTKFNIGHGPRSGYFLWSTVDGTPTGTPVKYSLNTPIFIVARYDIIGAYTAGVPNDQSSMWINPTASTFEDAIPPTATITRSLTGSGINDIDVVNRFYIRQDVASNTPSIDIDETRIGLTWASVTPKSISTGIQDYKKDNLGVNMYPNPVSDIMNIDVTNSDIRSFEIYNIIGKRVMDRELNPGSVNIIDLSNLPKGMYVISLKGSGISSTRKFMKN